MTHIEQFINNKKISESNDNLVNLQDLRLLKKVINEDDFIVLIKDTHFELRYCHLMDIKNRFIMEKEVLIANIIYENI